MAWQGDTVPVKIPMDRLTEGLLYQEMVMLWTAGATSERLKS
jgi:hypothetical protein